MVQVRAIYTSKMSPKVRETDIAEILESSRRNNKKSGLTGLLCFGSRRFLQCLEGPRDSVNETYGRIMADPRHSSIVMLTYEEANYREFEDWLMGYVPESSLTRGLLTRTFGPEGDFNPDLLGSQSALDFLRDVKACIPVV